MKIVIWVFVSIVLFGCSNFTNEPSRGYVQEEGKDVKQEILRSCWWCGNYIGPVTGTTSLSSPQRICSPNWGSCPSNTTLGDGSTWQFSDTCLCNG